MPRFFHRPLARSGRAGLLIAVALVQIHLAHVARCFLVSVYADLPLLPLVRSLVGP